MCRNKLTVFAMHMALLVTFLGLISMVFDLHRFAFVLEFLILLGLLLVGIIAAIGISHNMRWAWMLLALFFGFAFFRGKSIVQKSEKVINPGQVQIESNAKKYPWSYESCNSLPQNPKAKLWRP